MKVELGDEAAYELVRDVLVEDYLHLSKQVSSFERRKDKLKPYEQEDFNSWLKTIAAIDSLFDFYLIESDAKEIRAQGKRT
jgi:hypothetical protein